MLFNKDDDDDDGGGNNKNDDNLFFLLFLDVFPFLFFLLIFQFLLELLEYIEQIFVCSFCCSYMRDILQFDTYIQKQHKHH